MPFTKTRSPHVSRDPLKKVTRKKKKRIERERKKKNLASISPFFLLPKPPYETSLGLSFANCCTKEHCIESSLSKKYLPSSTPSSSAKSRYIRGLQKLQAAAFYFPCSRPQSFLQLFYFHKTPNSISKTCFQRNLLPIFDSKQQSGKRIRVYARLI